MDDRGALSWNGTIEYNREQRDCTNKEIRRTGSGVKGDNGAITIGVLLCTWPNERIYKVWYDR